MIKEAHEIEPAFSRLDHVQVAIPPGGEDRAREFYIGLLGFIEVPKLAELAQRGGLWLQSGDVKLHLGIDDSFVPAKKAHPGLKCAYYKQLLERLRASGIDVAPDPIAYDGQPHCYVADPFLNRLELIGSSS